MWSIAWRILKHESDALDCCQDVFAEALQRSRDNSNGPVENWGAFLNWLTTHRAIDLLRKRKRNSQPSLMGEQDVLQVAASHTADMSVENSELTDWVRNQLAGMNGQIAECFWLCCVDEMSYADVANQLGISTSHVGVNVHRARELLRKRLSEHACGRRD
jgi:RNA polymerase sigma-70 factor (ECF subfamily)